MTTGRCLPLPRGYIHVYSIGPLFSNIFSETAWPIKAKFHVESHWEGETKVYINGPGHMTMMAARPIYGKTFKIFFSRTRSPMILKLGVQHQCFKLYKVCINDYSWLTLTYFTARPNWVTYSFERGKLLQSHLMGKICSK